MNFPPLFRSLHSSLIIAFHYLPSPFITFHRRPISLSAHSLLSPVLSSSRSRFVLTSPRSLTMPPHSPASHLRPSCFITPLFHTSVFHAPLSAPPFFTPFVLLPPLFLLSPIVLRPLFYFLPLCFTLSHCLPPSLYLLPLFCTRFFTPRQPPQTRPRHRKRQRFSHFSKKFCKSP